MLGYILVSAIFGITAVELGLSLWFIALISLLVYAGTGQFIFLVLFSQSASLVTIVLTIFLVNLRYLLMSMYMTNVFDNKGLNRWFRPLYAFQITDESFAFQTNNHEFGYRYFIYFNMWCHISWIVGSVIGALLYEYLGDLDTLNLEYGITAMMMYVLTLLINTKLKLIITGIAVVLMIILQVLYPSYANIFIATIVASSIGVVCKKKNYFS